MEIEKVIKIQNLPCIEVSLVLVSNVPTGGEKHPDWLREERSQYTPYLISLTEKPSIGHVVWNIITEKIETIYSFDDVDNMSYAKVIAFPNQFTDDIIAKITNGEYKHGDKFKLQCEHFDIYSTITDDVIRSGYKTCGNVQFVEDHVCLNKQNIIQAIKDFRHQHLQVGMFPDSLIEKFVNKWVNESKH